MEELVLDSGIKIKISGDDTFRGWDAADEYILSQEINEKNILVIGDSNGALTASLQGNITSLVSSVISQECINNTLSANDTKANIISDVALLPESIDLVIVKLPKFIDLLEYYIQIIGNKYPGVKFLAGGMVKYMPITMVRLCEEYFLDVTTSLAKKKARLIFGTIALNKDNPTTYPKIFTTDDDVKVVSYPGVFSYDHLDIGTRFLLKHIPIGRTGTILDLGCGSGVLGLYGKKMNPEANIVLADESYLAVESARESFKENGFDGEFHVMDILKGYKSDSVDIILCNPPFHQTNKIMTEIAVKMFKQSRTVLKRGGTLFVVSNKHLGYHKKLRAIFHNLNRVAENEKFIIFSVRKV
ncbi:class I SAM-dependent methyltransferase [Thiospirochaeta perfilievii]|uniref:Class I SAM-dependent methyltransferase n=1 Tax=Thiospirochaeta perfilievii TaxID=252967 RepID=A0A5C1QB88_9SPIO|nr:class I SAM-dependent methyltransferase [Thiospirochaeta perfilievii]QEN04129.1 class I SAM-dependent methyltransferase [Thiospirochaeta perfilievii]